jgi:hypothetical protein
MEDEVALGQIFFEFFVSPCNHHPIAAPYSSITAIALIKRHIIVSSVPS